MMKDKENITSKIWMEEAEDNNPFLAKKSYLHGYDVFGDLLPNVSYIEYLYLLFRGDAPTDNQCKLLEIICIALANPGPRDHSVMAAMSSSVGGSGNAASLMAALAVGAGSLNGGRELFLCMQQWDISECDLDKWQHEIQSYADNPVEDVWPVATHCPGFEPHSDFIKTQTIQLLELLCEKTESQYLNWLNENMNQLSSISGAPISMVSVVSAVYKTLDFSAEQAEMFYLLSRLPGAAAHALEQQSIGWKKFPFWPNGIKLSNDPKK